MRMSYYGSGLGESLPGGASTGLNQQVTQAAKSATDVFLETIGKAIPLIQQQQIFNTQLKLAKQVAQSQGTYLDTSAVRPTGIPVDIGLDTNTKMMIGIGIGIVALAVLLKKR